MSDLYLSRRKVRLLLALGIGLVLFLTLGRLGAGAMVEVLWYQSVGYSHVFWKRLGITIGLRAVVVAVTTLLLFFNLRVVSRTLGRLQIRRQFGNLEFAEQIPATYLFWLTAGISGLLGLWFGLSVPGEIGVRTLLYFAAESWGLAEPILGHDVGFYVFALPLLQAVAVWGLILLFLLLALTVAGYTATGALSLPQGRLRADAGALRHVGLLFGCFLVGLGAQFWLGRYGLLLNGSGVQGLFGYTDAHANLPGLAALTGIAVLAGAGVGWATWHGRTKPAFAATGILLVGGLGIGQAYPSMVQRFQVEPNELERETPFIEMNLEATRRGFGLADLARKPFAYDWNIPLDWAAGRNQARGLTMWTPEALLVAFNSLEARFGYYRFSSVTVDRYREGEDLIPVALSVREIQPGGIENPTWQNRHLRERFIQGAGAVAVSATAATPEGRPKMFLQSIPAELSQATGIPTDLELNRPGIFFGNSQQQYAVVSPRDAQFLSPEGGPGERGVDYPRGISLRSSILRIALAWAYQDPNLFFSSEINEDSQFVIRRSVQERVREIAPFLTYLEPPQAVVLDGRVVWVMDGFTTSRNLPLSTPFAIGLRRRVSYIRASVKITVDAVTGDVTFYKMGTGDPILSAYSKVFPGLIQDGNTMSEALRAHLRYPTQLLRLQSQVLQSYHQETAAEFHGQQDRWATPMETGKGTTSVPYKPGYSAYTLPGEENAEFLLSTVFVPIGLQNLTALLIARCDPEYYGELQLYEFGVQDQVPGPRQVEALIEQDPVLSQQFSLWRQGGSEVWTGHLQLVPVGNRVLYVEPVFLAAEADAIPELRRFVVSDGRRVAMEESLSQAFATMAFGEAAVAITEATLEQGPTPVAAPSGAIRLLDEAEAALRQGNWAEFGDALDRLRRLLEAPTSN